MLYLQDQYTHQVSCQLRNFKRVRAGVYNFSCIKCGDLERDPRKAKAYLFTVNDSLIYKCHHCGVSMSFGGFLDEVDHSAHEQYRMERFIESSGSSKKRVTEEPVTNTKPVFKTDVLSDLVPVSDLPADSPARIYLEKRKLPELSVFYYCEAFKTWVNKHKPDSYQNTTYDAPRIIIPLRRADGTVFGVQGRSLEKNDKLRYITEMFDVHPKVFGLDRADLKELVYLVEGPFDSLFLPNALAMVGSDAQPEAVGVERCVTIYDNEPRSPIICAKMKACIRKGKKIVIWPSWIHEKDLNDMVLGGLSPEDLLKVVESRTFYGLTAELELSQWRKC